MQHCVAARRVRHKLEADIRARPQTYRRPKRGTGPLSIEAGLPCLHRKRAGPPAAGGGMLRGALGTPLQTPGKASARLLLLRRRVPTATAPAPAPACSAGTAAAAAARAPSPSPRLFQATP